MPEPVGAYHYEYEELWVFHDRMFAVGFDGDVVVGAGVAVLDYVHYTSTPYDDIDCDGTPDERR